MRFESREMSAGTQLLNEAIESLIARNELTMIRGRFRRRQKLLRLRGRRLGEVATQRELEQVVAEIEESAARRQRRAEQMPAVSLEADLPIAAAAEEIEQAIREHQVVVVTGATGSGKSTQLPLIMMRAGFGIEGLIGHTQPRRIAARGIAQRLAQQLNSPLGRWAGFKIRFADNVEPDAYVKLMTDGILLAESQSDRFLEQYQALIIDEAHERSLNIDFILGYVKQLLPQRPDLKVVITSATIDAKRFAEHFSAKVATLSVISPAPKRRLNEEEGETPHPGPLPENGAREQGRTGEGEIGKTRLPLEIGRGNEERAPKRRLNEEEEETPHPGPLPLAKGRGNEEKTPHLAPASRLRRPGPLSESEARELEGNKTGVPVIEVSGRTYPVEIRYRPAEVGEEFDDSIDAVVAAVTELMNEGPGDVLVFLPTEYDIRTAAKDLRGALTTRGDRQTEILPLYARLTTEQQNLVFAPHRARRIVLATNVAESSITVPGIRYVVDTGTARISRYAPRSKVQRLPIEAISRASADQRAGRCGRVGPGICVRLFSAEDYASRAQYTTPEIRRTNLASAILQTKALRLGELDEFPFLDPPTRDAIRDGYDTLFEIQAINAERDLTDIGQTLSRLPTDPRIGRILLAAEELNCLNEVAIIAAGLEVPDPRQRPLEYAAKADELHAQWTDPRSDFLSLLNLFDFYQRLKADLSRSKLARACQQNFLSPHHLREWVDVHRQLQAMIQEFRWRIQPRRDDYDAIHRALLTGFLSGVALRQERNQYQGAGGLLWQIWPGSGLAASPPQWIVAAELVETQRRYGRTLAKIQPQWIEPLAEHLMVYDYDEPHWSEQRQSCLANERATLFGLPVVAKRLVPYAPVDPAAARRVFIEAGLVAGKLRSKFAFHAENQRLREQVQGWAAKTRDRKFVVDDWAIVRFYNERLPAEAFDGAALERCLRNTTGLDSSLRMTDADLLPDIVVPRAEDFPDQLEVGTMRLNLHYRFEPGAIDDGINIDVPVAALAQLSQHQLNWSVPGKLIDLVAELIRCLPKSLRRNLVPVPDTAQRAVEGIELGRGELHDVVARRLTAIGQSPIRVTDFQLEQLPAHTRMNVRAVDDQGQVVAQSRDLAELRRLVAPAASASATALDVVAWNKSGLTSWDFGDLPESVIVRRGGVDVPLYPTLKDDRSSVSLSLVETADVARWHLAAGVARLFQLSNRKAAKSHVDWLPDVQVLAAGLSKWVAADMLRQRLADLVARIAVGNESEIRTNSDFERRLADAGGRLAAAAQQVGTWVGDLSRELHGAKLALESASKLTREQIGTDLDAQLAEFFGADFPAAVPWVWLQQYPRYLGAIRSRLERAASNLGRDRQAAAEIQQQWARLIDRRGKCVPSYPIHDGLVEIRWMLEELRVSLFAQHLGTRVPVSSKRLDKMWEIIGR